MRGIEAALKVLTENNNGPIFASEALRKLADREKMKVPDITLASSLIYIVMRRRELWEKISDDYLRAKESLPPEVYTSVIVGAGGILELRRFSEGVLINGIVEYLKRDNELAKYAGLVNAVLHKIKDSAADKPEKFKKSPTLEGRALWAGVPSWSLPVWLKTWSRQELNDLFNYMELPSYSSLRVKPGEFDNLMELLSGQGIKAVKSDISDAIHLNESILPRNLPGFSEGLCTVQSEGSIITASLVKKYYSGSGLILDMCSGRGIKAGQVLQDLPDSQIECWELSGNKSNSAVNELTRLGVNQRAIMKTGDALTLEPDKMPSFIILDSPCSCSGTWNRKPESKWRMDWKKLDNLASMQKKLLNRAVNLCEPGGHVLYITCSLLKLENENIVADVLANNPDCMEIRTELRGHSFRKGKPYGLYILPSSAWLDGFYCALIFKR